MWEIHQISRLLDYCEVYNWFVSTGFVAVCNPRLLITSLTVFVLYGSSEISDLRLLIITLAVFVSTGSVDVCDSRLLIISLIAFNGVKWSGVAMQRLC